MAPRPKIAICFCGFQVAPFVVFAEKLRDSLGEDSVRYSQLSLGDLAGSEGLRNVELTSPEQRHEGSCINKSLLATQNKSAK